MYKRLYVWLYVILLAQITYGHGDLDERIVQTTAEIEAHPDSAYLYMKRGELYYQHQEFENSILDFQSCERRGNDSHRLQLGFAQSYNRLNKLTLALKHLDKILLKNAHHVKALQLKARVLMDRGDNAKAAQHFEMVIDYSQKTFPLNYFEASAAWEKSDLEEGIMRAIAIIDRGIQDLGDLMNFYDRLIELNCIKEDYAAALHYQSLILQQSNRKERPYYDRALIFLLKGDHLSAKADLEKAYQAIQSLPQRIKNNRATLLLQSKIKTHLEKLTYINNTQTY